MSSPDSSPTAFTDVHLAGLVKDTLALVRSYAPPGIVFNFRNDAVDDIVSADAASLQQALVALVTNVCHAVGGGAGTLLFELSVVRLPAAARPETLVLHPGDYFRLAVNIGRSAISADKLLQSLDAFEMTRRNGLVKAHDLPFIRRTLADHRGTLGVEDTGPGASVFVYLPKLRRDGPLPETALPMSSTGAIVRRGRVLLVDDDAMVRRTLESGMQRMGYEVFATDSGVNALRLFEARPMDFDVVVTDQMMPGMAGTELGRRVGQLPAKVPLILMTGYAAALNEPKVRAMGFMAMLMKPVTMEELECALQEALSLPRPNPAGPSDGPAEQ